ncbi:hypothetical protein JHK86_006566 [Glycine max]|nr:hypothetical protein JHK86_006566 [Glycine max]
MRVREESHVVVAQWSHLIEMSYDFPGSKPLIGDALSTLTLKELKQLENRLERGITRIRSKKVCNDKTCLLMKINVFQTPLYCRLKDFVGAIGESTISKSSLDPFPIPSVKPGEDLLDDLETEERRDECCEAYSDDLVYELNEVAAAKGCLGRFPGGEMVGIIKKIINLDAGTD